MELIVLKVPPDKVDAIANAIQRDLEINRVGPEADVLRDVLPWLRYRHGRWAARHPARHKR